MNRDLIINSRGSEVDIALMEEKVLVELHREKTNSSFVVGDIYLGRIRKIIPGLNAAFVDIGYERDAFLHYLDLGPQIKSFNKYFGQIKNKSGKIDLSNFKFESDIVKSGKIKDVLSPGKNILVQVAKEPISNKGPRVSSEISFPGRFLVLVPFSDRISISQKIKDSDERNRLKRLVTSIRPPNFGVIIRTVAENKKVADLVTDLTELMTRWDGITNQISKAKPPSRIHGELDRTSTILRDLLNESFNNIHLNDASLYSDLREFVRSIAPEKENIVDLYKGNVPIFEYHGVEKQIKNSFGKKVTFKNGAYLIIEHTEALHVVDVNSGHRIKSDMDQESNALSVNLEAATEVARQLRLRDMGGIIVIDFIDLLSSENRKKLFDHMKVEMKSDNAKHTILPPSKFGLIQITRQRVRPEINIKTREKCPSCGGSGEIQASITLMEEIENDIRFLFQEQNELKLTLALHPYVYAYVVKGILSKQIKWFLKYKKWIKLQPRSAYHLLEYHFFNKKGDEIKL